MYLEIGNFVENLGKLHKLLGKFTVGKLKYPPTIQRKYMTIEHWGILKRLLDYYLKDVRAEFALILMASIFLIQKQDDF